MTDTDFLAAALKDGEWHSHSEILNRSLSLRGCGLTIHSRAADLRKRGHVIETRLERDGRGRTLSFYRRVLDEVVASPEVVRDGTDGLSTASSSTPSNPARHHAPLGLSGATSDSATDTTTQGSRDGDVLELFHCQVDESAGVKGAYWGDAA